MIVKYGYDGLPINMSRTHAPDKCTGRLCDIHGRLGEEPWASWPRNWREDAGKMEIIDPRSGIGHPSPAQAEFNRHFHGDGAWVFNSHGCDGGCAGAYDQLD